MCAVRMVIKRATASPEMKVDNLVTVGRKASGEIVQKQSSFKCW